MVLELACSLGFHNVLVEIDSKMVVSCFNGTMEIMLKIVILFILFLIYVECNMVAYFLILAIS